MSRTPCRGFTLIEVMVVVAIVAILAAVAMPAYGWYLQRSRVPAALDALSIAHTRLEQRFQDSGSYADGSACGVTLPTVANFTLACTLGTGGQSYTLSATGSGPVAGFAYSIDDQGTRRTTAHPKGAPSAACWSTRGSTCDT